MRQQTNNNTGAVIITDVLDKNNGEQATYKKVTKWIDGTNMDDSKCDGVIYRKSGGNYFKRNFPNGVINAEALGFVADGVTDNLARWNALHNFLPNGYGVKIYFPGNEKYYYFSDTFLILDKRVHLYGDRRKTKFLFPTAKVGVRITRSNAYRLGDFCIFEKIDVYASSKTAEGSNNTSNDYFADYQHHGILIEAVTKVIDCHVENFSGNGFDLRGNIGVNGTNTSLSLLENISVKQCGGSGIAVHGADANGITIVNPDVRDNTGYGVYDNSNLGIFITGGGFHASAKGHYKQISAVAVSSAIGTYFEGDSPDTTVAGYFHSTGGYQGAGITGSGACVQLGAFVSRIFAATFGGTYERVGVKRDSNGKATLAMETSDTEGMYLKNNTTGQSSIYANNWEWQNGSQTPFMRMVGYNSIFTKDTVVRGIRDAGVGLDRFFIGPKMVQTSNSLASLATSPYLVGDEIYNSAYNPLNNFIYKWVCIKAGSIVNGTVSFNIRNVAGNNTWEVSQQWDRVVVGDVFNVGGVDYTVTGKSYPNITTNTAGPVTAWAPVVFTAPEFRAVSNLDKGTTANRPILTANDGGFLYFDTTIDSLIEWTGTAWRILEDVATTLIDGATINTDASLGKEFRVTLAGNRTMAAPTNGRDAQTIRYAITQDATGNRTITWNGVFRFPGAMSSTLSTDANVTDYFEFVYNQLLGTWDCLRTVQGFEAPIVLP